MTRKMKDKENTKPAENSPEKASGEVEVWRPANIISCEGIYEVSSLGNIREKATKKPVKVRRHNAGTKCYSYFYAVNGYRRKQVTVQTVVASAFLTGTPSQQIIHLDGDFANCRADNLAYRQPKNPKVEKSVDDISIEYVEHRKGNRCDITILNIFTLTAAHFTRVGDLAFFLGISVESVPKFLAGEHKLCFYWKVVPYEKIHNQHPSTYAKWLREMGV